MPKKGIPNLKHCCWFPQGSAKWGANIAFGCIAIAEMANMIMLCVLGEQTTTLVIYYGYLRAMSFSTLNSSKTLNFNLFY